mmetsp:Transcript_68556/g.142951  ORF Transcript_68556/g.142951 Transcript_68556/m.142951 type:complete len:708 (+) Transcript_68556:11-2134(+)
MQRATQRLVPQVPYEARPADNSLASLLNESFKVLEYRFQMFDIDDAGKLMFQAIQRDLSKTHFRDEAKLTAIFTKVDLDKNGTLDFSEFLCLVYLWTRSEDLSHFFQQGNNCDIVKKSFDVMARAMTRYDKDNNRTLSAEELDAFFRDHLGAAVQSGVFESSLAHLYPNFRQSGTELNFPQFMFLLYYVMCGYPNSTLSGKYKKKEDAASEVYRGGEGEQSPLWNELKTAFAVLQEDFSRFDKNGNDVVDFEEITSALPINRIGTDKIDIITRLEIAFLQVDLDQSRSLDFYEFMYLTFMMTQNGSYHDLVAESTGSALVKNAFIHIHSFYRKYDEDGNLRLSWGELEKFCNLQFGSVPAGFAESFERVKYQSRGGPEWVVDVVRFMKLLYMTIYPTGKFHPNTYNPARAPPKKEEDMFVSFAKARVQSDRPPRFENVQPARFIKGKLLGKGGQGEVHLGTYDNVKVAGKTLLSNPDEETVKETIYEVNFFTQLDHPNCHYLLGSKTSLDNGGIILLTEVCDNGSLFEFYGKTGKRFDNPTAWRLARECAVGFMIIHGMGYMHRDIKSLNVFLSKDLVAKVADFGMCTMDATSTDACGTVQWMAPEVVLNLFDQRSSYDKRVDVYSYGVLLWEIFHCKVPYSHLGNVGQMMIGRRVKESDIRPVMGRACVKSIADLIQHCWHRDPNARPTFEEVIARLDACSADCGQ